MKDRRGVILLFFDLPMITKNDRREYNLFRKQLKRNGYISIQQSVLVKLIHNISSSKREIKKLKEISPLNGKVYAIPVCISNFMKLVSVSGTDFDFNFYTGNTIYI